MSIIEKKRTIEQLKNMDKEVQKLKKLVDQNLHISRNEIIRTFGEPSKKYDDEIWFYKKFRLSFFNDEIVFYFENDVFVDISLTQYFLWKEIKEVYYVEEQDPEYFVSNLYY